MSISNILGFDGKIINGVLPNPYPFPASAGLGEVLAVSGNALNPTSGIPQEMTNISSIGCADIIAPFGTIQSFQASLIQSAGGLGNLAIDPVNNLTLKGCQTKGSLLVGDGTSSKELPIGANGLVLKANSAQPFGVEWGSDASGGTVMAVNQGTNISVSGTIAQPIVNLATPLTSTLGMGSVALTDKNGASGTSGQFLSAGTGGETLWATPAYPVVSVSAGTNINISGTSTAPVINLQNPLTAELNIGTQNIKAGSPSGLNSTINNSGALFQSGGIGGGPQTASYGFSGMGIFSGTDNISISGAGITNADTAVGTASITNASTPTQVRIRQGDNIGAGFIQSTLTNSTLQYASQDLGVPTQTSTSTYDNCSRTAVSLDNTSGAIATRTEIIDKTLQSRQQQTLQDATTLSTINSNCEIITGTPQAYLQLFSEELTIQQGAVGLAGTTTQGEVGCNHSDFASGRVQSASLITTPVSSQLFLQTIGASSTGNIALNPGFNTDGTLAYNVFPSNTPTNFAITSNRPITFSSTNVFSTPTNFRLNNSDVGGAGNPLLTLMNTNGTGSVAMEVFKNKPTAGANGDVLFTESVFGKDSGNTKQEYTRITHTIRDATAGAEDGSMELGCFVNGGFANFIQLNANDAPIGEINFTRPLDFIGGSDANSTIKTSGTGSVNLNLDASTSAGAGGIVMRTKNGTGSLSITGDKMTSITAGGNSGHHLVITLPDPTTGLPRVYKINLFNP